MQAGGRGVGRDINKKVKEKRQPPDEPLDSEAKLDRSLSSTPRPIFSQVLSVFPRGHQM